jgi:hypothetical protein
MDRAASPTSITAGSLVSLFGLLILVLAFGFVGALLWLMLP